ncbi:MAG: glycoside hydrolase family 2, partial [Verrucomicrobiae bacterium]|nr:glycoside hydrolase family 2 [Verrucomicrobiae bacterium]
MKQTTFLLLFLIPVLSSAAPWKRADATLSTEWGENVTPDNAWTEYPRPQLQRKNWTNLNGLWNYSLTAHDDSHPGSWNGEILVPFCIESPLSGVGHLLEPDEALWYQRSFELKTQPEGTLLLNFDAVDYECDVWVNGERVGSHRGGNLPFTFDITSYAKKGNNTLRLKVLDATSAEGSFQLRGKQRLDNRGIWYTRVSGIHQTVWLEEVPNNHIENLRITTTMDGRVNIQADTSASDHQFIEARVSYKGKEVASATGSADSLSFQIKDPQLWSPDAPNLYDLTVTLPDSGDTAKSYFGIREVGMEYDDAQG